MTMPSYQEIFNSLGDNEDPSLPAELHGFISGMLCGLSNINHQANFNTIIDRLMDDEEITSINKEVIAQLALVASEGLESIDLDFQLLLPDDESSLFERCEAFVTWSRAFLSGIGLSELSPQVFENPDIKEALWDISKLAKTSLEGMIQDEDSEIAYCELVEYIRMAVLLIYTHTHSRSQQSVTRH